MKRRESLLWMGLLAGAAALPGCENKPEPGLVEDDTAQRRLIGTWLREYREAGVHIRRVATIKADGTFEETSKIVDPQGSVTRETRGGEWFFDGINFKRKYTLLDGKPVSSVHFNYTTLELKLPLRHELIGVDNVRKREIRYLRVADGTQA